MAIGILAKGRLLPVLSMLSLIALSHWPASSQPAGTPAARPQSTVSEQLDDEQRTLDKQKARAEIDKLKIEWWTVGIAPALSALSVLMLAITLILQRKTQIEIQQRQKQADFQLKAAELVLNSRNPAMAKGRAALLTNLYPEQIDFRFRNKLDRIDFPGALGQEIRMEVFKQLASKYSNPADVAKLFFVAFPDEKKQKGKWFEIDDIPAPSPPR